MHEKRHGISQKIMFKIENDYTGNLLRASKIDGYDMVTVAEHCRLLQEYGFIDEYKPIGADSAPVITFLVGNLTWEGYDFLEKIREETIWDKTKNMITEKGLPMILDVVKEVSTAIIISMTEGAIKAILKQ